ncbi:MAG TPA: calcium/sodium antiporter [Methylomirabilota bacterium]|nr:calcium/sodium antiporter [Methylomirabilota bacterium]
MIWIAASIAGGLLLLIIGGELLVRGSVKVAEHMGLSPLIIGLTLVGFGTSAPELVTSVQAALIGAPGIAVGNVVGSNIANALLILGIAALLSPIAVPPMALKRDGSIMLASAVIFAIVGLTVGLERWVGAVFIAALAGYLVYAYRQERVAPEVIAAGGHTAAFDRFEATEELIQHQGSPSLAAPSADIAVAIAMAVGGLVVVVVGGRVLVDGAVDLARIYEISETIIGLTIVAVGTSMPELVTAVVAAYRGHGDVALGNVLGSNIYNTFGIAGVTGLIAPTAVPWEIATFDAPVMVGVSAVVLVMCFTNRGVSRVEGGVLLAGYLAYLAVIWP